MSVRVVWASSEETDIASYRLERCTTSAIGTYTEVDTIVHDLGGANYEDGEFFYEDATGQSSYWYRLIAIDEGNNESSPSSPFQASSSETPDSSIVGVDIFIEDDSVSPAPIEGVNVGIFDTETYGLIAAGLTDSDGRAALYLTGAADPGQDYEVRLFKLGVVFANPKLIAVLAPLGEGETNQFEFTGTLQDLPVSSDSRCCRVTGRFMDVRNQPVYNAVVRVMSKNEFQKPKVVDSNMVSAEGFETRTDSSGKVSFDLVRGGEFYVTYAGEEDTVWNILVPDRTSANLIDLIHPKPVSVDWDAEDDEAEVAVGETETIDLTILFSDYQELDSDLSQWVEVESSDEDVVTATISGGSVVLTGVASGSATVTIRILEDFLPNMVPDPSSTALAPTLAVTVV